LNEAWTPGGRGLPILNDMERRDHRFVVHVWYETGGRSDGQWRGAVEHVGHDRRLYFSSFGDLTDFINARIGEPVLPAPERSGET